MTVPLPANVRKAIAAEMCEPDANEMYCVIHQTASGFWPCPVGPEAMFEAMVESLGLTEERCCDDTRRAQEETGKYNVYTCDDSYMSCRTRLVSKWSER